MPRGVYERSPRSEQHKANLAAAWTEQRRKAQSERQTGAKHSEEAKAKIARSSKLRMTEEEKRKLSEWNAAYWTDERRAQHSLIQKKKKTGFSYDSDGYRILTGQRGHPLAQKTGRSYTVREHRKVLYDAIGPGPHECHWGCGQMEMLWSEITVDHLNGDIVDNRIENLVPSCRKCNVLRSKAGNPINWVGKQR